MHKRCSILRKGSSTVDVSVSLMQPRVLTVLIFLVSGGFPWNNDATMINMKFFRVVLALLGGTHVLCAQPSASPTVKSAGEYHPSLERLNIDIEER